MKTVRTADMVQSEEEVIVNHLRRRMCAALSTLAVVAVGSVGQFVIWAAASPLVVYAGIALTSIGYSLAFPAFGVEAVRLAPPQSRGTAMGAYVVFLDIALGLTGPVAGFIAGHAGYGAVYLVAGCTMLCGVVVAWRLMQGRGATAV